jgi:hypothetical protein
MEGDVMTVSSHIETIRCLLLGLDTHWTTTDGKIKATWLSMIGKLAAELELIAMAESETLQTKHEL